MTMGMVMFHSKVKDFSSWKKTFDSDDSFRKGAGISNARIFRSAENGAEVVVLMDFQDLTRAKQFTKSGELKTKMTEAGVLGAPEFVFLNAAS
jgi:hypothetical protein